MRVAPPQLHPVSEVEVGRSFACNGKHGFGSVDTDNPDTTGVIRQVEPCSDADFQHISDGPCGCPFPAPGKHDPINEVRLTVVETSHPSIRAVHLLVRRLRHRASPGYEEDNPGVV